jgi:hypothetical protein
MKLETLKAALGHRVLWEKYNLATGKVELLQGTLISAGVAENIGKVEFAEIEEAAGRCWITTAEQVKEIVRQAHYNKVDGSTSSP